MDYRRRKIRKSTWLLVLLAALFGSYAFGSGNLLDDAAGLGRDASRMLRDMGFGP
jgi:hypothetical protein